MSDEPLPNPEAKARLAGRPLRSAIGLEPLPTKSPGRAQGAAGIIRCLPRTLDVWPSAVEIGLTGGRSWLLAGVRWLVRGCGSELDPWRWEVRYVLVTSLELDGLGSAQQT